MLDEETEENGLVNILNLCHLLDATVLSSLLDVVLLTLRRPEAEDDVTLCFALLFLFKSKKVGDFYLICLTWKVK